MSRINDLSTVVGALGADIPPLQAAVSSATAKLQNALGSQVFDVRSYGAVLNGSSQQVPFQAANDAAVAAGGGTLYIPPGSFHFDGPFVLGNAAGGFAGINLLGDSLQTTVLKWNGPASAVLLQLDGLKNCTVGNFTLQNEVGRIADTQILTVTGSPTGTFTMSYAGSSGNTISPTASAATVQAALEAIQGVGLGQVLCTGGPLGTAPVTITLTGFTLGTTTQLFTLNLGGLTGGTVTVARTGTGSKMTGMWLQRHTGSGTQIGSLNFKPIACFGWDIGILAGNGLLSQAASELHFDHLDLKNNGIGLMPTQFNTLDIHCTMLEMGSNNIGLCMGGGSGNISVMNGSNSQSKGSDFCIAGSNSGTLGIYNFRSEDTKRFVTAFSTITVGLLLSGCDIQQSIDGPNAPLVYMDGGRLTVLNSYIYGQIVGRYWSTPLSITLIDSFVADTLPFRVSTGYANTHADTLQHITYCILNSHTLYPGAGLFGNKFPDQVGCVPGTDNVLVPLWSANTDTQGSFPNLYVGGNATVGWSAAPLYGGLHVARVPNPTGTLQLSAQGGTGSTTYTYYVVAIDANGHKTLVGPATTITNGLPFGSLDATHYNGFSWVGSASYSAVAFDVIRSAGGTTQGSIALGLKAVSMHDTGLPATAYVNPTRNATADLLVDGWFAVNGKTPAAPPALPAAAVDPASTQVLVNALRSALIAAGITT